MAEVNEVYMTPALQSALSPRYACIVKMHQKANREGGRRKILFALVRKLVTQYLDVDALQQLQPLPAGTRCPYDGHGDDCGQRRLTNDNTWPKSGRLRLLAN